MHRGLRFTKIKCLMAILLAVILLLSITSCAADPTPTKATEGPPDVVLWAFMLVLFTVVVLDKVIKALIHKEKPLTKVEFVGTLIATAIAAYAFRQVFG